MKIIAEKNHRNKDKKVIGKCSVTIQFIKLNKGTLSLDVKYNNLNLSKTTEDRDKENQKQQKKVTFEVHLEIKNGSWTTC